jgi:hypothetical protein
MGQRQVPSLRQEIKLSQSLQLQQSMRDIRERFFTPSDDSKVIDMLAAKLASTIQDDNLKQIIALFLADKKAKDMMCEKAMMLSIPKKENLAHFIYQYLFQSIMEAENKDIIDSSEAFKEGDEKYFIKAFTDRMFLEHEAKVGEDMVKLTNANVSREYKMAKKALTLVDQKMIDYAKQLSQVLGFILVTKIKKEEQ